MRFFSFWGWRRTEVSHFLFSPHMISWRFLLSHTEALSSTCARIPCVRRNHCQVFIFPGLHGSCTLTFLFTWTWWSLLASIFQNMPGKTTRPNKKRKWSEEFVLWRINLFLQAILTVFLLIFLPEVPSGNLPFAAQIIRARISLVNLCKILFVYANFSVWQSFESWNNQHKC